MWHDMFVVQIPIAEKVLRTVLVYATILVLLRLEAIEAALAAAADGGWRRPMS
jgi:hypothetical protein